jgi:L,D-transpeptidase ErfK/SrfK
MTLANKLEFKHRWIFILICPFLIFLTGCQILAPQDETITTNGYEQPTYIPDIHHFPIKSDSTVVGEIYSVSSHEFDTLSDIARNFGLGYEEIERANPNLDPWLLQDNQSVTLPIQFILPEAPKQGIVLNLASMRLFYFPDDKNSSLLTFPVGIGRDRWDTPLGLTKIIEKRINPQWTVPASILKEHKEMNEPLPAVIKSGPDNPLGLYAMNLGFKNFLIHGTNKPYGIGMQVSHGCIQLYPEDIQSLFEKIKVGTNVRIVHQPYLATWHQNHIYLEAHPPIEKWTNQKAELEKSLMKTIQKIAQKHHQNVNWEHVKKIIAASNGIPTKIDEMNGLWPLSTKAVKRPQSYIGQIQTPAISSSDWSVQVVGLSDYKTARKLSAMLNHQGPSIPSYVRTIEGVHEVIAGPYRNSHDAEAVLNRIRKNFEMEAIIIPPINKNG